jgi:Mrp family chromosome partitioning ATPase
VGRVASSRAEAYRTLAFHLRHGDAGTAGGTLLVVAPKHDHDTEAAAVNLAAAFAEFGEDVLLVDATASTPGLAARLPLLTEEAEDDADPHRPLDGRVVVDAGTAGRITLSPDRRGATTGDIPMSPMVARALPAAASGRSLVVVTRPLLEHADGLAVAQRADGVLIVGVMDHTRRDELRQVRELINCSGGRIVGAVLCTGARRSPLRAALDGVRRPGSSAVPAARADAAEGPSVISQSQQGSSAQDDTLTASKG